MSNFRDELIEINEKMQESLRLEREARQRQRDEEARDFFVQMFEREPDQVEGGGIVTCDGVKLLYVTSSQYLYTGWRVMGECPHCGKECLSEDCSDPATVGAALANFRPAVEHECPEQVVQVNPDPLVRVTSSLESISESLAYLAGV